MERIHGHKTDVLVRNFDTGHQFIALLHGQLSGAQSLRAIETALESHGARLYHMGAKVPRRSTFAEANRDRSPVVFSQLLEHMLGVAARCGAR